MPDTATRHLYLARHGEAAPDGGGLTAAGRRQAALLGRRLADRPLSAVHHGPLPRAAQTARLVAEQLGDVAVSVCEEAGDYVPYLPGRDELPADSAEFLLRFLAGASAEERSRGPELARRAVERFTGPVPGGEERHELLVTHAFLIGWLVRHALDAPPWRWLGLNAANAALTVLRFAPGRPPSVVLLNDQSHLPEELRWTGFPVDHRW
ncbi:histidine phosphatase family protein [Streptomyces sp. FH025]|uniref:histidine phosphatase family protein n=1 Tax=Streptomyces sp. FH025 TaxID=2815937 RepID=UPI001A9E93AD|nr:histidine phosphatase family protein [Streptomyces sp. FH025]MBO1419132.1 histidine phosphatase family protein [Streptomyces sp. FH025]